ncbi:MAG TPA: N-6 DNA methylase, partial [Candidatus Paceibacterota bacterium]|nr:N-6 DNA methylase [Candidatus Paceibacterota bacterium]
MPQLDTKFDVQLRKDTGAHYTPASLANFVATQILDQFETKSLNKNSKLRIIDPAVGDGELLHNLVTLAHKRGFKNLEIFGFDINQEAVDASIKLIEEDFPSVVLKIQKSDFLEWVLDNYNQSLFSPVSEKIQFDIVIANPPYVRTQVMGSEKAKQLAEEFHLSGRVDLYHAFLKGIEKILKPKGTAGIIVSNRFLTTKSGELVRKSLLSDFNILHVWDLGDTRLFDAAVLPAVLLLEKTTDYIDKSLRANFTSIYVEGKTQKNDAVLIFDALEKGSSDLFKVLNGTLDYGNEYGDVWRLATQRTDDWLEQVRSKTKLLFKDIGKVKVGIKTTADNVFIVSDTSKFSGKIPETLQPLITHHIAFRFKADKPIKYVVYTHELKSNGEKKRSINLSDYPITKKYLESHKEQLAGRTYIADSNRNWFEIWVPHDPDAWKHPKLVFRDISEQPIFWMDLSGAIVNGDCY